MTVSSASVPLDAELLRLELLVSEVPGSELLGSELSVVELPGLELTDAELPGRVLLRAGSAEGFFGAADGFPAADGFAVSDGFVVPDGLAASDGLVASDGFAGFDGVAEPCSGLRFELSGDRSSGFWDDVLMGNPSTAQARVRRRPHCRQ